MQLEATIKELAQQNGLEWWVQWAALGIGIAWFVSLSRVIRAVIVAGGLAALGAYLLSRHNNRPV